MWNIRKEMSTENKKIVKIGLAATNTERNTSNMVKVCEE